MVRSLHLHEAAFRGIYCPLSLALLPGRSMHSVYWLNLEDSKWVGDRKLTLR